MKDTIVLRSSTLLSEVSPHFNYPDQVSQYFSDTYGENHIVFKTTETLGNYEKHVVVLKFDQCGVANRVKQRYNGRVLFNSRITTTFLDARQVEELGLDRDKVATSLSTSKKKKKLQPVQKEQEEWMYRHGLLEEEEEEEEKVKLKYEMVFFSEGNEESARLDQSYESYDTILPPAILPEDSSYTKDRYSRNTADLDNDDQDSWTYYRTKKERDRRRKDRSYEKERDRSSERHRRHRSSSSTSSSHTVKKDTSSRSSRKRYREDRTESYNSSRSQSQSLSDDMTQDSMLQRDTSYPNYLYNYSEQYYCSESQDYTETDSTGLLSQDSTEWVEYYGSNPIVKEEPINDDCEDEEDSDNNGQVKQVSFVLGDCLAMLRQNASAPTDIVKASKESVDKKDKSRHSNDSKRHKKSRESRRTSSERDHHKRKRSYSEQDLESDEGSKELQPPKKLPKSRKDDSQHNNDHHQKSNESSPPEKEESIKSKHESSPLKKDDSTRSSRSKETVSKTDSSSQEKSTQKKDHQKKEDHVKRHSTSKASKEDSSRSSKEHGAQSSKTEETKKEHTSNSTSSWPVKHSSTQSQKEVKKDSESGKSKKDDKSLPTRDDSSQETNTSSKENSKQELSLIPKKNESKESTDNSKNDVMSQVSMVTTPTNTMTTTTQPILAGPPNIGPTMTSTPLVTPCSITTPSVMPSPLATMVPTLASTPLVTPTNVVTASTTPTPTVPIMVPIYLPCTPEYQQMLLTHYQQLALTNPSASLWPYPVEDTQQFTRSRSGTPVMDETEEIHPTTTTTPTVENKLPYSTSDLPIAVTCTNELQQTQSTTYTSTKINNQSQSIPISQISVTQSVDAAQFTLTNSTITSSVITTPPIALIPVPVTQSNGKVGSVESPNKPFVSEPNNITVETQFDSVDSSNTPITNIPSVSYEPAISDSFITDVSPHTQPLDPNVIQTPDMQKDEEESIIENPPSPLSLKRIDPDVNFKKYKSETMKEYWEQAKILLASTKLLASVSDPNQSMDITSSLEKSLQLVARNLLTNFRKRTGIMEDTFI